MPEIEQLKFTSTVTENQARSFKEFGLEKGDTIYRVPAASYCNFFISNNVVLIPKYWKPGLTETQKQKDEEVKNVFTKLFPDRQIVQIFTLQVNRGGGGIHCMTHELPISKN
jgi:agmatine deiminase